MIISRVPFRLPLGARETLGRALRVLSGLLEKHNFFEAAYEKNRQRKGAIIEKIKKNPPLQNRTVGVLGATYERGTSNLRRSLPLEIVFALHGEGRKFSCLTQKRRFYGKSSRSSSFCPDARRGKLPSMQ